jgi:predicted PurR-regulated permease PerM
MPERLESTPERLVRVRPRVVFVVLGVILAAGAGLWTLWVARQVVTWILISMFLALALNPAVEALQRRGVRRRGVAVGIVYLVGLLALVGVGGAFLPTLIGQVSDFVAAVPGYVRDLTAGRGPLGFLERDYQVVEKVQQAVDEGGSARLAGGATAALSVTRGVATAIAATVTIAFMTLFMLLEGRQWLERFYGLLPLESAPRWRRVGDRIYHTIGGYVTGNLLISVVAGISATIVLLILGVPYAIALGVIVALLDLIPLAGALIAMVLVTLVGFTVSTTVGLIVLVYFLIYQQIENQVLQPIVYGRTVNLSPLAVLIAVLIGAQVAGVLGALGAIPIAGAIQVILVDWHEHRQRRRAAAGGAADPDGELAPAGGAVAAARS